MITTTAAIPAPTPWPVSQQQAFLSTPNAIFVSPFVSDDTQYAKHCKNGTIWKYILRAEKILGGGYK